MSYRVILTPPRLSNLLYTPSHALPDPHNILMITRIRRCLVHDTNRLLIQLHEISLKRKIANDRLLLLAITPVILEEQRQASRRVEIRPLDRNLLDVGGLRYRELLSWRGFGRGVKVHRVGVDENFERLGAGGRGRGADQDRVQAHLAREGDDHEELFVGAAFQLGGELETLCPGLLADGAAAVGFIFVESYEFAEVDLFVEEVLQRGRDVVAVVVAVMAMVMVLVVAVRVVVGHGGVGVGCRWWGRGSFEIFRVRSCQVQSGGES
jgi:hypothetical protein